MRALTYIASWVLLWASIGCREATAVMPVDERTEAPRTGDRFAAPGAPAADPNGQPAPADETRNADLQAPDPRPPAGPSGGASTEPTEEPSHQSGRPLRVAVISDMNGDFGVTRYDPAVHAAVAHITRAAPDLVLSTGDMVAGQRGGLDYEAMWTAFDEAVEQPFRDAGLPFAITPGNHDASGYRAFEHERSVYAKHFGGKEPAELLAGSRFPFHYAFELGPALFISLDATTSHPVSRAQRAWVEATLEGSQQPVRVVFGHLPIHPFTHGRETQVLADARLERVLRRGGVELILSGHHHAYFPGRRGPLRMVSLGCTGGGPRRLLGTEARSDKSIVTIQLDEHGVQELEGWTFPGFGEAIAREALPERLGEGDSVVFRDDVPHQDPFAGVPSARFRDRRASRRSPSRHVRGSDSPTQRSDQASP